MDNLLGKNAALILFVVCELAGAIDILKKSRKIAHTFSKAIALISKESSGRALLLENMRRAIALVGKIRRRSLLDFKLPLLRKKKG
ncbi:MAG: hypothetical protein HC789_08760 [Microcoleus sp. CSU_2_2]|nr:hypothetical protein [Microcoleus sp. CSU_2_2]